MNNFIKYGRDIHEFVTILFKLSILTLQFIIHYILPVTHLINICEIVMIAAALDRFREDD